jgi:hypothetical protein
MSGPDVNRLRPGSNAIGNFIIGVSPIGDIPTFDIWATIISQYANSDRLTTLISNFFQYVDQTVNMQSFFDLVWNVDTAQGWGLDVALRPALEPGAVVLRRAADEQLPALRLGLPRADLREGAGEHLRRLDQEHQPALAESLPEPW